MGVALIKGWMASQAVLGHPRDRADAVGCAQDASRASGRSAFIGRYRHALPPLAAVVLAIKPQVLKGEGDLLGTLGETGALVLSIAAGVGTPLLRSKLGSGAPFGARHAQHAGRDRPRDHRAVRGRETVRAPTGLWPKP